MNIRRVLVWAILCVVLGFGLAAYFSWRQGVRAQFHAQLYRYESQ